MAAQNNLATNLPIPKIVKDDGIADSTTLSTNTKNDVEAISPEGESEIEDVTSDVTSVSDLGEEEMSVVSDDPGLPELEVSEEDRDRHEIIFGELPFKNDTAEQLDTPTQTESQEEIDEAIETDTDTNKINDENVDSGSEEVVTNTEDKEVTDSVIPDIPEVNAIEKEEMEKVDDTEEILPELSDLKNDVTEVESVNTNPVSVAHEEEKNEDNQGGNSGGGLVTGILVLLIVIGMTSSIGFGYMAFVNLDNRAAANSTQNIEDSQAKKMIEAKKIEVVNEVQNDYGYMASDSASIESESNYSEEFKY